MLGWLLTAVGALLIAVAVVDSLWTVLWSTQGAGPVSSRVTGLVRTVIHPLARRSRRLLSAVGPLALLAVVGTWVLLMWVGAALLLQGDASAVRDPVTDQPAGAIERAYFAAYTLFTMGNGDFSPHGDGWRIATGLVNGMGMVLVTLSVTFLIPVVSASVQSRSFASEVLALGRDPSELLARSWDGRTLALADDLRSLASQLSTLGQQHLTYPVLHLFHSVESDASAPLAVAVLDDALLLLDVATPAEVAPSPSSRRRLRSAIDRYLETVETGRIAPAETAPPAPSLEPLRMAGVPLLCAQSDLDERAGERRERRRRLAGLVDNALLPPPTADWT